MFPSRLFRFTFILVALAPLSSADTLTVGPAGSGAQFTEIQAAIDAAQDDDVILVQPGDYQRIVVDKPLRILGDGTGTVAIGSVIVRDIGAGEELVLSDVRVNVGLGTRSFFRIAPARLFSKTWNLEVLTLLHSAVHVENCARTLLLDSRISGGVLFGQVSLGVFAQDSTLWIANSEITVEADVPDSAGPGVVVRNTTMHVWRASIRGGDLGGQLCDECGGPGGPGVLAPVGPWHERAL